MKTYPSYEAAKIANPESNIYVLGGKFQPGHEAARRGEEECNPANHCMTDEEFLADGHKFVNGDIVLHGELVRYIIDDSYNEYNANCDPIYILRAAALEENIAAESDYDKGMREAMQKIAVSCGRKFAVDVGYEDLPELVHDLIELYKPKPAIKPRTKAEYVKVDMKPKEIFMAMLNGEEFYVFKTDLVHFDGEQFWRHASECKSRITFINHEHEIYRRIETEISERQEFIEAVSEILPEFDKRTIQPWIGKLYDSGKFKLVEGE